MIVAVVKLPTKKKNDVTRQTCNRKIKKLPAKQLIETEKFSRTWREYETCSCHDGNMTANHELVRHSSIQFDSSTQWPENQRDVDKCVLVMVNWKSYHYILLTVV